MFKNFPQIFNISYFLIPQVGIFLDKDSKSTLYLHLDVLYNNVTKLEEWQNNFYELCFREKKARVQFDVDIEESERTGNYGVTTEKRFVRDHENNLFEQCISAMRKELDGIGCSYEKYVKEFLLMLTARGANLQRFATRLDFNEYYKNRDSRLLETLTYNHMRMSGFGSSLMNGSGLFGRVSGQNFFSPRH